MFPTSVDMITRNVAGEPTAWDGAGFEPVYDPDMFLADDPWVDGEDEFDVEVLDDE